MFLTPGSFILQLLSLPQAPPSFFSPVPENISGEPASKIFNYSWDLLGNIFLEVSVQLGDSIKDGSAGDRIGTARDKR